jgi:phosphate transport system ATP-binding protein
MVFQKPNPFPKSIYDNVAYGPRIGGTPEGRARRHRREALLRRGAVGRGQGHPQAERPTACPAGSSSGCASPAAIAVQPEVILMDEPCSALDPIATAASRT